MNWEPVIGLEIHVHLKTRTKMFCRCAVAYGDDPNTNTCPVCLGHPGSLPVPNGRAVEWTGQVPDGGVEQRLDADVLPAGAA